MARQASEGSVARSEGGIRKRKPKALSEQFLRRAPVQSVDERANGLIKARRRTTPLAVDHARSTRWPPLPPPKTSRPPTALPRISSRPSSRGSHGSRKRRRRSPAKPPQRLP